MNLFGNPDLRQVRLSIRGGDLESACHLALRSGCLQSAAGLRVARRLVRQLIDRAGRHEAAGQLAAAWDDLSNAVLVKPAEFLDDLARRQTALVETTVRAAESRLQRGQPASAARAIELLRQRRIADRRADELAAVCRLVQDAETLSSAGRWNDAAALLEQARAIRPSLEFIQSRIRVARQGRRTVSELTDQLRRAITGSQWAGAAALSDQILQIAPHHQVALDARRHCHLRNDHQAERGGPPELLVGADDGARPATLRNSVANDRDDTRPANDRGPLRNPDRPSPDQHPVDRPESPRQPSCVLDSFILWVDGVGGFLVCTSADVTIGRAVEQSRVDIPLQADIRRRHLRIKRSGSSYIAEPLDQVDVDRQDIREPVVLRHDQILQLAGGVRARFTMPHPLGGSARLDFTSRHRTDPWSDAVLLLGDAIMIGRLPSHHIVAPDVGNELLIYRQGDRFVLRDPGKFEVNDQLASGEVPLRDGLRIVGDGYSISVEQICRGGAGPNNSFENKTRESRPG